MCSVHGAYRSSVDASVDALTSAVAHAAAPVRVCHAARSCEWILSVCMTDRVCDVGSVDAAVAVLVWMCVCACSEGGAC